MHSIRIILTVALMTILSCSKPNLLESNITFNTKETQQIITLLDRFDEEICKIEGQFGGDIEDCYASFFERIWSDLQSGDYDIGISLEDNNRIIETLSPSLANEFWYKGTQVFNRRIPNTNSSKTFPDTIQSFFITNGKYFEFLKNEVSQIDSKSKQYVDVFSYIMDISPSLYSDVAKNYMQYNISDERIRLLIAIHYITLNTQSLELKASQDKLNQDIARRFEEKRKRRISDYSE